MAGKKPLVTPTELTAEQVGEGGVHVQCTRCKRMFQHLRGHPRACAEIFGVRTTPLTNETRKLGPFVEQERWGKSVHERRAPPTSAPNAPEDPAAAAPEPVDAAAAPKPQKTTNVAKKAAAARRKAEQAAASQLAPVEGFASPGASSLHALSALSTLSIDDILSHPATRADIPKRCRANAASALANLLMDILAEPSLDGWKALLLFPSLCLVPMRGGRAGAAQTNARISRFVNRDFTPLLGMREAAGKRAALQPQCRLDDESFRIRRALKLTRLGEIGKALQTLVSTAAPVELNERTIGLLQSKFPNNGNPAKEKLPETDEPPFDRRAFDETLKRLHLGSGADAAGWRYDHVKLLAEDSPALADALFAFAVAMATKDDFIPAEILPHLAGGRLVGLTKGETDVRPIGIGLVLKGIVERAAAAHLRPIFEEMMSPFQVAVGLRGGAEMLIHGLRLLLAEHDDFALVALDQTNAFNRQSREAIARALNRPQLRCLGHWSNLAILPPGVMSLPPPHPPITVHDGVIQGSALSAQIYALMYYEELAACQPDPAERAAVISYADDTFGIGRAKALTAPIEKLTAGIEAYNGAINRKKCWSFRPFAADIQENDSPRVLGASLFPNRDWDPFVKAKRILKLVGKIPDPQVALLLLRNAVGSATTYAARTHLPQDVAEPLEDLDQAARSCLASILGTTEISDDAWHRACSPSGLGLPSVKTTANAAFAASAIAATDRFKRTFPHLFVQDHQCPQQSAHLQAISEALEDAQKLIDEAATETGIHLHAEQAKLQKTLADRARKASLEADAECCHTQEERAQALSQLQPHANAWLSAIPCVQELSIPPPEARFALRTAIGVPVLAGQARKCICGNTLSTDGLHLISCRGKAGHHISNNVERHNRVVSDIAAMASDAQLPVRIEVPISEGRNARRMDIIIGQICPDFSDLALDVSIVAPSNADTAATAATTAMYVASKQETAKNDTWTEECTRANVAFHPAVFEATSAPTQYVDHDLLPLLAARIAVSERTHTIRTPTAPTPLAYWRQRISTSIIRETARRAIKLLAISIPSPHAS